ncbi:MAG TPA: hypothetical protein VIV40_14640, partial [Kofleriaceae bacterium]
TCTIDNNVGTVTSGQTTMVTLSATTTFRLTCANRVGMTSRDTVISIPLAPPTIATFTATPSSVMPNAATTVTFDWTYSTAPSPPPTCTIDAGIGAATKGMTASLTLAQARTFRLRCQNTQGVSTRDVSVAVNECTGGTADCGPNTTCTDTPEGYTCACAAGYSASGDACGAQVACGTTPSLCDVNASCVNNACFCKAGYVGDGTTCTREKQMFVTTSTGTGNLSLWSLAGGKTGLAAADQICQTEATNNSLLGTYVAWMSDATSDAYCRVHGLTGKKPSCNGAFPTGAGPWVRTDVARSPAAPTIDKLLAPTRQTFMPVNVSAAGTDLGATSPLLIFTSTDDSGVLTGTACTDWTAASGTAAMGDINGGGKAWTDQGADLSCSSTGRLRCVETGSGPALLPRHPTNMKRVFVTSVSGSGLLSTWSDSQGLTGINAADAVCQARARYAGYTNAASFKAWASYSGLSVTSRIIYQGPWYRPDGILVASSKTDMTDGRIGAPIYLTEANAYVAGDAETSSVWTGSYYYGSYHSSGTCSSWLSSTSFGVIGRTDLADYRWVSVGSSSSIPTTVSCSATDYRLYCVDDTP